MNQRGLQHKRFTQQGLLLGVLYLVLLPLILNPQVHGNDGIGYFSYLHSMVMDRDFDFTNEFSHYEGQYVIVGYSHVTGRPVNGVPMGSALLWMPFYLGAHLLLKFFGLFIQLPWDADGYSYPYVYSIGLASSLYALAGLWLTFKFTCYFYKPESSLAGIILGWMATPLVFYMYLHPSMAHANSFFLVSSLLYLLLKIKDTESNPLWRWGLLGIILGLLVIVRNQDIILWGLVAWIMFPRESCKMSFKAFIIMAVCAGLMIFPQMIAWKSIFGSWLSGPESHQIAQNTNFLSPHIMSVLFSGRHGLFTWHPMLLVGLAGWYGLGKKDKALAWTILILFLFQVWVTASWREWWGAHSFGHRMFVSMLPLFMLGITAAWDYLNSRIQKRWLILLAIGAILWNLGLIYQYGFNLLDRDGTTPFATVIINQFLLIPSSLFHWLFT